jgi:hypothetical protein
MHVPSNLRIRCRKGVEFKSPLSHHVLTCGSIRRGPLDVVSVPDDSFASPVALNVAKNASSGDLLLAPMEMLHVLVNDRAAAPKDN